MRNVLLSIFLLVFIFVYAGKVSSQMTVLGQLNYNLVSPPKTETAQSLYQYLYVLYQRWMELQITTKEPNGNIGASVGSIILYNNSGTYFLAVETADPSGSTWKGIQLGSI